MRNSLTNYIADHEITVIEDHIPNRKVKGLCFDNVIVLDRSLKTEAEKQCILAEEIGHYETSTGHILNQKSLANQKQEITARRWAHKNLIPLERFIECFEAGCRNRFETAEFLDVTEEFLEEAIKEFQRIYGAFIMLKEYALYFEPFGIMKRL
jgi:hypothetical protein